MDVLRRHEANGIQGVPCRRGAKATTTVGLGQCLRLIGNHVPLWPWRSGGERLDGAPRPPISRYVPSTQSSPWWETECGVDTHVRAQICEKVGGVDRGPYQCLGLRPRVC